MNWRADRHSRSFGEWADLTWIESIQELHIHISANSPFLCMETTILTNIRSLKHAEDIGFALQAFLETVAQIRRQSIGETK